MSAATAIIDRAANVQRSPRALTGLGILLSTLLIGAVVLSVAIFRGTFTDYVAIQAAISSTGNAAAPGNLVVYREVPVGTVASSGRVASDGRVTVALHIDPDRATFIPSNVTATIDPVTVFGTEAVILELPAHPDATHLVSGDSIAASTTVPGANVQGAISSLDSILNALHPAQLDTALTAIATALSGQGKGLGKTLDTLNSYLKTMLPHLPLLEDDLGILAPVANQVASSAPALVGSLSNLSVTATTITSRASELRALLAGGADAAGQLSSVIAPDQKPIEAILAAAGPFFKDVSQSPTELSEVLSGLSSWATSWSSAERSGPYLSFSTSVSIANATDLVFAALNASGSAGRDGLSAKALGVGNVDPTPYSSRSTPATDSSVRVDPAIVTPSEQRKAATLAADLNGGKPVASPAVASLYLNPLLTSLVVGP